MWQLEELVIDVYICHLAEVPAWQGHERAGQVEEEGGQGEQEGSEGGEQQQQRGKPAPLNCCRPWSSRQPVQLASQ